MTGASASGVGEDDGDAMTIDVIVADDVPLLRGGICTILDADPRIRVVGEAGSGAEAVELVLEHSPEVAVIDIRMPGVDGLEATRRLQQLAPSTQILIVTMFHLDDYVLSALRAGAAGYLLKDAAPEELVAAVHTVARGDALLSPAITHQLISHYVRRAAPDEQLAARLTMLTSRELDVVRLVARGLTNAEVAAELGLGEGTVKTHVTNALSKLGLRSRTQIVVAAYEGGLVTVGGAA